MKDTKYINKKVYRQGSKKIFYMESKTDFEQPENTNETWAWKLVCQSIWSNIVLIRIPKWWKSSHLMKRKIICLIQQRIKRFCLHSWLLCSLIILCRRKKIRRITQPSKKNKYKLLYLMLISTWATIKIKGVIKIQETTNYI